MHSNHFTTLKRILATLIVLIINSSWLAMAQGIPALKFDLKKPSKFEEKKLGSEKSEDKKFSLPRRIIQNTITHYNWQFNATEKLKFILERAVEGKKEDYTQLLPFYSFSTEDTQRDSLELDSVVYKANAGILLHDLRNGWVDDLYLLMGKAYYYKKNYDSAFLTFQYINYAFSPKEKDGYDKVIGSNSDDGGNAFSIATNEKRSLPKKLIARAPIRNESFLWLIKTHIAMEEYVEAGALIDVLSHDPNFPSRLGSSLHEMQALLHYSQERYDSAAFHLEKALEGVSLTEEKARWEYLAGQLYELSGNPSKATEQFNLAVKHTLDPILDVYARLNAIRQNRNDAKAIEENIASLLQMAKKDRYTNYRDIIYYSLAKIELELGREPEAIGYLQKSTKALMQESADPLQHSRSFLLLGDLYYSKGDYIEASKSYDSVDNNQVVPDIDLYNARKDMLGAIVKEQEVIKRQDSLQKIAALPVKEREELVRKLSRALRKAQGLQEEEQNLTPTGLPLNLPVNPALDAFNTQKGEWYFYNASLKTRGMQEFKSKWGNRPNVDNWRRMEGVNQSLQQQISIDDTKGNANAMEEGNSGNDLSAEGLMSNLPLTEESLKKSNDSIAHSQVEIGKLLVNGAEDWDGAIKILETNIFKYTGHDRYEEALHLLYLCYKKKGYVAKAEAILKQLQASEKGKELLNQLKESGGKSLNGPSNTAMNQQYEKIYGLFISGKFQEALKEKSLADSLYSNNYWTPQLLYIEAIYHIKQREDSLAIAGLQKIIDLFPDAPLSAKAANLQQVLARRAEIEAHLTNLKIDRPAEENTPPVENPAPIKAAVPPVKEAPKNPAANKPVESQSVVVAVDTPKVSKNPEPVKVPVPVPQPVITKKDTTTVVKPMFVRAPETPHFVLLIMEDVDPVYVNESKNAFFRYIKQRNNIGSIELQIVNITDKIRMLSIGSYTNEKEALEQTDQLRKSIQEIVPWLPASSYKFGLIGQDNLKLLQANKEMEAYRKFMKENYLGRF